MFLQNARSQLPSDAVSNPRTVWHFFVSLKQACYKTWPGGTFTFGIAGGTANFGDGQDEPSGAATCS